MRQHFQHETCLEDAVTEILNSMTGTEKSFVANHTYAEARFIEIWRELSEEASDHCLFDGLEDTIGIMEDVLEPEDREQEVDSEEEGEDSDQEEE